MCQLLDRAVSVAFHKKIYIYAYNLVCGIQFHIRICMNKFWGKYIKLLTSEVNYALGCVYVFTRKWILGFSN